jgi:hypothetical protein
LQAQLDAQARPADRKGQKTALEKEKQALAAEKQALEARDAALRAAMKEFDAKVEALAAREAAMEEKEGRDGGRGEDVPEEHKNVAAEVKQFDTTATIRKQIDEQEAVLTQLFDLFEDVDVEDCKFKITHVAKNLLGLERKVTSQISSHFAETLRSRLPCDALVIRNNGVAKFATFNDILTAAVGCAAIPKFNSLLAHLRQMGIATDLIATAAFGQHGRRLAGASSVTFCAIRNIPHEPRVRTSRTCGVILRGGIKQCPQKARQGGTTCSRHSTKKRQRVI